MKGVWGRSKKTGHIFGLSSLRLDAVDTGALLCYLTSASPSTTFTASHRRISQPLWVFRSSSPPSSSKKLAFLVRARSAGSSSRASATTIEALVSPLKVNGSCRADSRVSVSTLFRRDGLVFVSGEISKQGRRLLEACSAFVISILNDGWSFARWFNHLSRLRLCLLTRCYFNSILLCSDEGKKPETIFV